MGQAAWDPFEIDMKIAKIVTRDMDIIIYVIMEK